MTVSVVQQAVPAVAGASGTSYSVTLPSAPTSGNQLLLWLASGSSADSVASGVTGWTLLTSFNPGTGGKFFIYTKTSAGTETTTSITFGTSTSHNIAIQEWPASANFGTVTSGYLTGLTTSSTLGPTDAPPAGGGTPAMFVYDNGAGDTSFTFPAGWTQAGPYPTSGFPYYSDVVAGGTSTSSAVTAVCTKGTRATTLAWSNVWVYATSTGTSVTGSATTPAATASGTATASTQATGSTTAQAAAATGSASSTTVASGSATAPAATASGAASSGTTTAVGNATAPQATASGVSSSTTTASGNATAPGATASGFAGVSPTSVTGSAIAPQATAAGQATSSTAATGAAVAPSATAAGTATVTTTCNVIAFTPRATASGSASGTASAVTVLAGHIAVFPSDIRSAVFPSDVRTASFPTDIRSASFGT